MRRIMILAIVAAMVVSASAAWATVGFNDGLSYNPNSGGAGYFDGITGGGAYPYNLASPNATDPAPGGPGTWVRTPAAPAPAGPKNYYTAVSGSGYVFGGVYDYDDYIWMQCFGTPEGDMNIQVIADVEMWEFLTLGASTVYFHQGQPGDGLTIPTNPDTPVPQSADIPGTLSSNNGQFCGLVKNTWTSTDKAKADGLVFLEDGWGRNRAWHVTNRPNDIWQDIPIAYSLDDNNTGTFVPGAWSGGNNSQDWGYWWLVNNGDACVNRPYTFRLTITPLPLQTDGRYYLDPTWATMPAL
ncbi:MAG TPA: hypothetical protein VM221_03765 [Armatimonadota bacterium]|nr:hypothetical protein [Armatimonadota bacterium]